MKTNAAASIPFAPALTFASHAPPAPTGMSPPPRGRTDPFAQDRFESPTMLAMTTNIRPQNPFTPRPYSYANVSPSTNPSQTMADVTKELHQTRPNGSQVVQDFNSLTKDDRLALVRDLRLNDPAAYKALTQVAKSQRDRGTRDALLDEFDYSSKIMTAQKNDVQSALAAKPADDQKVLDAVKAIHPEERGAVMRHLWMNSRDDYDALVAVCQRTQDPDLKKAIADAHKD